MASKEYYIVGDDDGLHIFDTLKECIDFMMDVWGFSEENVVQESSGKILKIQSTTRPTPKNATCNWTL